MAKKEKTEIETLKDSINKLFKNETVAYFLGTEDNPSDIKEYVSTGNAITDLIISNRKDGGLPVGKIIEITGLEASGKSLLASTILKNTQTNDGVGVYIDTESAVTEEFLYAIGIDTDKLLYIQLETLEEIFETIEKLILEVRGKSIDKLITIVVDSVAGATTVVEQGADYNKDGWATSKAIILSKAMRKITNLINKQRVLLIFTNQLRTKLGCVHPSTKIHVQMDNGKYTISMNDLFKNMGHDYNQMEIDTAIDVSSFKYKVAGYNDKWNDIKHIIRKKDSIKYIIEYDFETLETSGEHKILCKENATQKESFIEIKKLYGNEDKYKLNKNVRWYNFTIVKTDELIPIVDFNLGGDNTYMSNNVVSHNTMFGDPYTTSGGKSIAYHSSVRLRLKQNGQLKDKNKNVIGINTKVIVSKNRIAPPLRSCNFDILFNKGIDEFSGWYDVLKENGFITVAGAWSKLEITDEKTGEIEEYKFYQKDFIELFTITHPHLKDILYDIIANILILEYDRSKKIKNNKKENE